MIDQHDDVITIFAEAADAAEVVESPSLAEAYEQGHDSNDGDSKKRERAPREAMPSADTLSEAENTTREWTEAEKLRLAARPKKEITLSQAYSGEEPEDADVLVEQDGIPEALQGYGAAQIGRAMSALGLTHEDLTDERWQAVLLQQLEASDPDSDSDDGDEEGTEDEATEEEESAEKPEQKPEVKPLEEIPPYLKHENPLAPEFQTLMQERWARSQHPQFSDPRLVAEATGSLYSILTEEPKTEEERFASAGKLVGWLQFQAQNVFETQFLPFLQHHMPEALNAYAPNFQAHYTNQTLSDVWEEVRLGKDGEVELPAFSLRPSSEFQKLREKIATAHPYLDSLDFKDAQGRPLDVMTALRAKAQLVANLLRDGSRKVTAAAVQDAIDRGVSKATKSARRVSASSAAGRAGRTTGAIGKEESTTTLRDAYRSQHGNGEGID